MNQIDSNQINLKRILATCKQVWLYCLLIVLFSSLIGFGITKYMIPKKYEATAKIIVVSNQNTLDYSLSYSDLQVSQKLTDTYAQIIMSERISDIVIQRLRNKISTNEYRNLVRVSANSNTEIMNVITTHTDPRFAATLANEIVHVFLNEISTVMPVDNVSILNHAKVPEFHASPSISMNTAIGFVLGIMLSSGFILLLIYMDRTIKDEDDLSRVVTYPYIGSIPNVEMKDTFHNGVEPSLVSIIDSNSIYTDAYRILRTSLMLRNFDKELKVINVMSCGQGEGKTTLMINLAIVLSQINKKVLLIDLDLRAPKIHKMLRLPNSGGVTGLIQQDKSLQVNVQTYQEIDVVTAGETIPFTSEFLQSNVLSRFIASARNQYDYILLDCPPAGIVTDGTIVSNLADGTILVVGSNMVERKDLVQLDDLIRQFDISIIGCVMTRTPLKRHYEVQYYHVDTFDETSAPQKVAKGHA